MATKIPLLGLFSILPVMTLEYFDSNHIFSCCDKIELIQSLELDLVFSFNFYEDEEESYYYEDFHICDMLNVSKSFVEFQHYYPDSDGWSGGSFWLFKK